MATSEQYLASIAKSLKTICEELQKYNSTNKKLVEQTIRESRSRILKDKKLLTESK